MHRSGKRNLNIRDNKIPLSTRNPQILDFPWLGLLSHIGEFVESRVYTEPNYLLSLKKEIIFLITRNFKILHRFLILTFIPYPNSEGDSNFSMSSNELTWINVVISLTSVLSVIGVSTVLRLGIGLSLLIAGLRCVGQLALVASILHEVFETRNPWLVSLICCAFVQFFIEHPRALFIYCLLLVMLNFLGTFEIGMSILV